MSHKNKKNHHHHKDDRKHSNEKNKKFKKFEDKLKFSSDKNFKIKDEKNLLSGVYRNGRGDFGFVDTFDKEGKKTSYYVFFVNRLDAFAGDEVLYSLKDFKGRKEAVIEKITKRADKVLTGTFQDCSGKCSKDKSGFGFVILDTPNFKKDVFIPGKDIKDLQEGDKVALKIINWDGKNPEGKIIEKIGKTGDKYVDVMAMAYEGGARPTFPLKLIESIKNMPSKVEEKDLGKLRKDIRNLFTYTIDPDDAKDFDDAISIEKLDNGNYKLYVHIADVTHYVREGNELDREAKLRGTSIYFVDRVVPMLPEVLSNGLCSLNPFEDKVCLTCEMEISTSSGEIIKSEVYESLIKSDFRLSYRIVEDIKNLGFKDWSLDNLIVKNDKYTQKDLDILYEKLKLSYELKQILEKYKKNHGYIDFGLIETKIYVDEHGYPIEIKPYPTYEANKVIEFFMVAANEAVAKKYSDIPFLYRIHPRPEEEDIDRIKYALKYIGVQFSDDLTQIVDKVKGRPEENFINKLILRSMTRAVYSPINDGHYGLGLEYYSHFTSPIRRYPDLQIHRIIKEKLNGELTPKRIEHYKAILTDVASLCSEQERQAQDIEQRIDDYLKARFMKDKIGDEFEGLVSGVIERGFFVQLLNTVEGFVDMSSGNHKKDIGKKGGRGGKTKERLDFDSMLLEIRNSRTGQKYRLGDKVRIKVKAVDEDFGKIEFELAE